MVEPYQPKMPAESKNRSQETLSGAMNIVQATLARVMEQVNHLEAILEPVLDKSAVPNPSVDIDVPAGTPPAVAGMISMDIFADAIGGRLARICERLKL
jgi:hypothetical protein